MIGQIRNGIWPMFRGAHVVMPALDDELGYVVYDVWEIRARKRSGRGWAMCVARFISKIEANRFARQRNARFYA